MSEERLTAAPLRLMHVVDVLAFGGMEYGVIRLVNRLNRNRFAPMICCLSFKTEEAARRVEAHVPVFALGKAPGRDLGIIFKLAALLRRQRVDVVHSHNWRTFLYTWAAASLARVPVVIHGEHGRETRASSPWRQRLLSRWLANRVTRLATVSDSITRELVREWGVAPERVTTIPNGVDLEAADAGPEVAALRAELDLAAGDFVVISIGRLRPVKDYPTLLRGFARARSNFPQLKLLVVGADQGGGVPPELRRLVNDLGIGGAVRFTGVRSDVAQLLALSDVYVNTSVYEGMSNTILEAMAARLPVIATAVGGSPDLVRDGVTGYLIPAGDDAALAARIADLAAEPERGRPMGEAGRRYVESNHSMARMIQGYADLYRETLAGCRSARRPHRQLLKSAAARALSWSGVKRGAELLRAPELAILAYHRVLPLPDTRDLPFPEMAVPRDLFEAQMAHLARHYRPLDLVEAVRLLQAGALPRRAVAVTFDDGYRDNYDYAWPILRKYGVPATFFVVTGALDGKVGLWWEAVAEQIRVLARRKDALRPKAELPPALRAQLVALANGASPALVTRRIVDHLNNFSRPVRQEALRTLAELVGEAATMPPGLLLSWKEVRELHASGMSVGTHTVSHAFLDELSDEEAAAEIEGSATRLHEELGTMPRALAYPRGRNRPGLERLLRRAGIEVAVTTALGCNPAGSDPYVLSRLDSGYLGVASGFDPVLFEVELQGLPARLRNAAERARHHAASSRRNPAPSKGRHTFVIEAPPASPVAGRRR